MKPVAYVQQQYGDWRNENCYRVATQFQSWGYEVRPFEYATEVDIPRATVAYGTEATIHALLRKDGRFPPESPRYPYCLRRTFLDMLPVDTTLGPVREALNSPEYRSVFIQPSRDSTLFDGRIVSRVSDILDLAHLPAHTVLWKCPVINFKSEYRAYIHKGDLTDMWFLRGDPTVYPDPETVKKLLRASREVFQTAFTLTFGVAYFQERPEKIRFPTLLVGCGEIYAEETSCTSSENLAHMALSRWAQLFSPKVNK